MSDDASKTTDRELREFFPAGTQLKSPGGFSLDVSQIIAIQSSEEAENPYLEIHLPSGAIRCKFYRNIDGGPAQIYEIHRRLWHAKRCAAYG